MRSKHKKSIPKTRGHKVERKYVPIRKHASSHVQGGRQNQNTQEYCEDSGHQGNKDSGDYRGQENQEKYTQAETLRDTENSEKSVHPGLVQTMSEMSSTADDQTDGKTEIEAEELSEL